MIDYSLEILENSRANMKKLISGLSSKEMNKIPSPFSNNILWNLGHVIVTQQLLTNKLCGLPLLLEDEMIELFRKGSKPKGAYSEDMIEKVTRLLTCTVKDLKEDYHSGIFKSYSSYTTSFGVTISTIEEAIQFLAVHDGMHLGYILALRKAIAMKKGLF